MGVIDGWPSNVSIHHLSANDFCRRGTQFVGNLADQDGVDIDLTRAQQETKTFGKESISGVDRLTFAPD